MQYVGQVRIRQCRQANYKWQGSAHPDACDQNEELIAGSQSDTAGYPSFPKEWHFSCDMPTTKALSESAAKDQITRGLPFMFSRVEIGNGIEHMMVVRGYGVDSANHLWLCVMDPYGFKVPCTAWAIPYADYQGNNAYEHKVTYYEIKATP
jgi:hypothetical protein